jgi:hypothetical protein
MPEFPPGDCAIARIDLQGRFDIAARIAMERYDPADVNEVIIANGVHPTSPNLQSPDALIAGPLARAYDAPLLLMAPPTLLASTVEALEYLRPTRVTVVGPRDDIIDARLRGMGLEVEYLHGTDRYDTAAIVAQAVLDETGAGEAVITSGADAHLDGALAAAAAAADLELPLLFVDTDVLTPRTATAIGELFITWIALIGGPSAISASVETELAALASVTRYGGVDAAATATVVAGSLFVVPLREALLVRGPGEGSEGATYALGLTSLAIPILFTRTDPPGLGPATFLADGNATDVTLVGNDIAIGSSVEREVCWALYEARTR